jgi:hypothetical protein
MRDALVAYFAGEKLSSLAWGFAGIVSLAAAAGIFWQARGHRMMLAPLIVFGLIQLAAAFALGVGTDRRVEKLLATEETKLRADEAQRIARVNATFVALEAAWGALATTGAALALFARRPSLFALGLGLLLEGSAMLALDAAAARRSHAYADALR